MMDGRFSFAWQGYQPIDIFVSGFVCKAYSQESNTRYQVSNVADLFASTDQRTEARWQEFPGYLVSSDRNR